VTLIGRKKSTQTQRRKRSRESFGRGGWNVGVAWGFDKED